MKPTSAQTALATAFILTLGVGAVAGLLASRISADTTQSTADASPLSSELRLTAEQQRDMKEIWEGVQNTARNCYEEAQAAEKDRDRAIVAMLSEEQKSHYADLNEKYERTFHSLSARRDAAFQTAVQRTRAMLNESQRHKYDLILQAKTGRMPPQNDLSPAVVTPDTRTGS